MSKKLQQRSKNKDIDISDFYALKVKSLWQGLKQEHISLWMICIYFFFEYVRPQSLYPVIDIIPYAQIFLLLTLATTFFDKTSDWSGNIQNKTFILFNLIVIISGLNAFNPTASWDYKEVMLGWFIVYFVMIRIVNTEKRLIIFLLCYLLFNLKMGQHGAISWGQRGFSFESYGLVGSPGWFRNSGEYAIQMLIFGSLAFSFVIALKNHWSKRKKWILYACASTGFMAVMGASSRGAQISLAVIGVWFMLKQKGGFKGLLLIIALSILLFQILPEEQINRFKEMGEDKNSLQRLAYWEYGLVVIKEHVLLGIGYHNWVEYLQVMVPDGLGPYEIIEEPHNIYIQAFAELGIFGLIFFVALVFIAFLNNARTRKIATDLNNKLLFYLSYGLDAGLIGFLVAGSFVTVLYYPFVWIQLAMISTLSSIAAKSIKHEKCDNRNDIK